MLSLYDKKKFSQVQWNQFITNWSVNEKRVFLGTQKNVHIQTKSVIISLQYIT